jgi:hypothetical protein
MLDFPLDLDRLASLGFNIDFIEKSLSKNYRKGLTAEEQSIAKREAKDTMSRAKDPSVGSKELYKDWESDKRYRGRNKNIPKSKATKAFESRFAEDSSVDEALKGKAKASGISLSILREVYNRGMAAWRSGHRPGVAPQQWALGRVNSFVTGVGKARKADADLWAKHKKTKRP